MKFISLFINKIPWKKIFFYEKNLGTYASMLPQKKPDFPERFRADNGIFRKEI